MPNISSCGPQWLEEIATQGSEPPAEPGLQETLVLHDVQGIENVKILRGHRNLVMILWLVFCLCLHIQNVIIGCLTLV